MPTINYGEKTIYVPEGYRQNAQAAIDRDIHRAVNLGEMFEYETQDYLDAVATSTMLTPIAGDIAGMAADANMYATDPDSRNWFNYLFTAAGILPFVPAASQVRKARKTARKLHEVDNLFHGSNTDFEQFSDDAIGGGQGAQMIGHGHYFSSSEDKGDLYRMHGLERDDAYEDFLQAERAVAEANEDYNRVDLIERLQLGNTPKALDDIAADPDYDDDMREMASELAQTVRDMNPNIGKMYQVETPNITEDEIIDWDATLENQPPIVQEFFANQPMPPNQMTQENPMYGFMVDVKNKAKMETDRLNAKMSNKVLQQRRLREQLLQKRFDTIEGVTTPNYPGDQPLLDQIDILDNEINDILKRRDQTIFGSNDEVMQTQGYSPVKKEATRQLLEGGIKGVKYLDTTANPLPGSNKKGATNYVIFDARLIDIAKKYGVTIPSASLMLYGATNQGYEEDTSGI
jgi:hypothetical protein